MHNKHSYANAIRILYHSSVPEDEKRALLQSLENDDAFMEQYRVYGRMQRQLKAEREEAPACEKMALVEAYAKMEMDLLERAKYEAHLVHCPHCRQTLSLMAEFQAADIELQPAPAPEKPVMDVFLHIVREFVGKAVAALTNPLREMAPVMVRGGEALAAEKTLYVLPNGGTLQIVKRKDEKARLLVELCCSDKSTPLTALNAQGDICFMGTGEKSFEWVEECALIVDDAYFVLIDDQMRP